MHFRLITAIFDFQHTRTLESLYNSLNVLPGPENMGRPIVVEIIAIMYRS